MNTTKILALALLFAGCGASMEAMTPPDAGTDAGPPPIGLTGTWAFHLVPYDRVVDTVPPPCDGTMFLVESADATLAGSWACTNGSTGNVDGQRYSATEINIAFYSVAWGTTRKDWGGGPATVTASEITVLWPSVSPAPVLTASRQPK